MHNTKLKFIFGLALVALIGACKNPNPDVSTSKFTNGAFIVNEGPFNNGTGTVSYLNKDNGQISRDIFKDANGSDLGNIVQSLSIRDNKEVWVVVNNGGMIKRVDLNEFRLQSSISNMVFPRYMYHIDAKKSYITEWTDSQTASTLRVYNHFSQSFEKTLWLPAGAEEIAVVGNRAYVTCNGGFGNQDKLAIIDIVKDSVIGLLAVGPNPDGLRVDASNNLWILCSGQWKPDFTSLNLPGQLLRYNTITGIIDRTITMSSLYSQPQNLKINGNRSQLYYNYDGAVHTMAISASTSAPVVNGYFYGLGIDPGNGDIYCGDAGNFTSNGKLRRFTTTGKIIDSFVVGIAPNDIVFIKQ
jgi:hypothetical protein